MSPTPGTTDGTDGRILRASSSWLRRLASWSFCVQGLTSVLSGTLADSPGGWDPSRWAYHRLSCVLGPSKIVDAPERGTYDTSFRSYRKPGFAWALECSKRALRTLRRCEAEMRGSFNLSQIAVARTSWAKFWFQKHERIFFRLSFGGAIIFIGKHACGYLHNEDQQKLLV